MTHKESFDGRFSTMRSTIDEHLIGWLVENKITNSDLRLIADAAQKLEIELGTRSAVDVLYDIACRLSIFEAELVSPEAIMKKVKDYLNE